MRFRIPLVALQGHKHLQLFRCEHGRPVGQCHVCEIQEIEDLRIIELMEERAQFELGQRRRHK